jgi:hypothetical protein
MSEITINGRDYLIGRLNARQQLNVAKRLSPVIEGLLPIWHVARSRDRGDITDEQLMISATAAITRTIHVLSDNDSDYVLDLCLGAVKFRDAAGSWAPLRPTNGSGQMMLDEADNLPMTIRLLWEVIRANVENFSLETLLPPSILGSLQAGSASLQ